MANGVSLKNIWISVSGAKAQERKIATLANNIANVNTAGFKRDDITFKEYMTALEKGIQDIDLPDKEWAPEDFYRTYGADKAHVKVNGTYTDFSQGPLEPSDSQYDLAINGKGFFEVLTPTGVLYTRKGNFQVNTKGVLTTRDGHPLLSASNLGASESIENKFIKVGSQKFEISTDGSVLINNEVVNKVSVKEFNDPHALKKINNGYFANPDQANIKKVVNSTILQKYNERSNVNALSEMSELIKAHRHFESIQRAIKMYDQIEGKAVNEIAKF